MVIQYSLTLEDYIEARTAVGFGTKWLVYGTFAWIGLAVLATGIAAAAHDASAGLRTASMLSPLAVLAGAFFAMGAMQVRQVRTRRDIARSTQLALLLLGILMAIVGFLLLMLAPPAKLFAGASLFGAMWCMLPLFMIIVMGMRMLATGGGSKDLWNALVDQHRPRELELLADGVVIRDGVSRVEMKWPAFTSTVESRHLFILLTNPYSLVMVPKRSFASDADVNQFRQAIAAIAPSTGGFPVDLPEAQLARPSK